MWRGWIGTGLGMVALVAASQAADPEDGVVDESALSVTVYGPPVPVADAEPVGVFFDRDGNACIAEATGVSCLDDSGDEIWGVDLPAVRDLRIADDAVAVDTSDGWVMVGAGGTQPAPAGRPSVAADGRLAWIGQDHVEHPDGRRTPLPDVDVWDVILHSDGQIGVIDTDGGLLTVDDRGELVGERADLQLGRGDWLQVQVLDGGTVAALDGDGLVLFGRDGSVTAEVDVRGDSLRVVDGGLWVAGRDGLVDVASDGSVEVLYDGPIVDAAVHGEAWAVLEADGELRIFDGDEPVGGVQHEVAVKALAPGPQGRLASVDEDGQVLVWSAAGEPAALADPADDLAWDGTGGLWLVGSDRLVRRGADGAELRMQGGARFAAGLPDGVLVGDGEALWRLDADGTEVWRVVQAHGRRPVVADGVVLLVSSDGVAVLDLLTGARRRRLPLPGRDVREAGVAVGGLVVAARLDDGQMGGFRPGGVVRAGYGVPSLARSVLGPGGRWVAWAERELVVRNLEGWPILGRATRPDPDVRVRAMAADPSRVWLGREDGRIERWDLGAAASDPEVPRFAAYAQLDAFTPPAELTGAPVTWSEAVVERLAVHPDGTLAVGPDLALLAAPGRAAVPPVDPPVKTPAVIFEARLGLVVGTEQGRVLQVGGDGGTTLLAEQSGPVSDLCALPSALVVAGSASVRRVGPDGEVSPVHMGAGEDGAPPRLACGVDGGVHVDLGQRVVSIPAQGERQIRVHPGGSRSVVVLPDGSVVTGGNDETVVIWDSRRPQPLYVLEGHGAPVTHLDLDAEGRRLVAGTAGGGVVVWDLLALQPVGRMHADQIVTDVSIDAEGLSVTASTRGQGITRWSLPAIEPLVEPVEGSAP